MTNASASAATRCEVELDVFSGMPNPTWALTNGEAERFAQHLAELPRTSPRGLSGHLGYRGFIVRCTRGPDRQLIHIQNGGVHVAERDTEVHLRDTDRALERWLLHTGRGHVASEIYAVVEREVR
jgi:hypothetical protein